MAAIWGRHLMFISLEGIDGSGKSTQARLLVEALGGETVAIREPGGTDAAERIRELLADPAVALDPLAELLLFLAARADLTERVIRPALEAGRDVVSDRFSDSSVAYQGAARGLGVGEVIGLCDTATDGLWPDLTLLLQVDPELGLGRADGEDRFESEGLELQRAVATAYEEIATIASDRVVKIDATGSVEEVHARVMAAIDAHRGEDLHRGEDADRREDAHRAEDADRGEDAHRAEDADRGEG